MGMWLNSNIPKSSFRRAALKPGSTQNSGSVLQSCASSASVGSRPNTTSSENESDNERNAAAKLTFPNASHFAVSLLGMMSPSVPSTKTLCLQKSVRTFYVPQCWLAGVY